MSIARGTIAALTVSALLAAPQSAAAQGPWEPLRRPLDLQRVGPDDECPVSPIDRGVDWQSANIFGGAGRGPGPVYPGLKSGNLRTKEPFKRWYAGKLFWFSDPSYGDRFLIRGRRLDGRGSMGWPKRGKRKPGLRIKRGETVEWDGQPAGSRGVPSTAVVGRSGCYGVQIDGTTFSRVVVFTVSTP